MLSTNIYRKKLSLLTTIPINFNKNGNIELRQHPPSPNLIEQQQNFPQIKINHLKGVDGHNWNIVDHRSQLEVV